MASILLKIQSTTSFGFHAGVGKHLLEPTEQELLEAVYDLRGKDGVIFIHTADHGSRNLLDRCDDLGFHSRIAADKTILICT